MRIKLLSDLLTKLHITLFVLLLFAFNVRAQNIETGDVVAVSVNSGKNSSIDIIPLIDIEKGTEIKLTNRFWSAKDQDFYGEGDAILYAFDSAVKMGSVLRISNLMNLDPLQDHVYVYTEDEEGISLVFGMYWDSKPNKIFRRSKAEDVAKELKESKAYVELSFPGNHQYFVKNGASGTKSMLKQFISEPAYWNNKESAFPEFGTSFQILKPPVVQFDEVRSTFDERKKEIILDVAIYEHDGSDLFVAVKFDEQSSTLSLDDLNTNPVKWFNFEGLIGDAIFEMKFQIEDDKSYEQTELAVFMLDSLSKGSYGDFRFHNSFVRDNDLPKIEIVSLVSIPTNQSIGDANFDGVIDDSEDQFVMIQNKEEIDVDISGWKINSPKTTHIFSEELILKPNEVATVFGGGNPDSLLFLNRRVYTASEGALKLSDNGGKVRLFNGKGNLIAEREYSANQVAEENTETLVNRVNMVNSSQPINPGTINTNASEITSTDQRVLVDLALPETEGWHFVPTNVIEYIPNFDGDVYSWSADSANYQRNQILDYSQNSVSLVYIEQELADTIRATEFEAEDVYIPESFDWLISFVDINENGGLDETESLIPLSNPTNQVIRTSSLTQFLSTALLVDKEELTIFTSENGEGVNVLKEANERSFIAPFKTFWLKSDQFVEEKLVNVSLEQLISIDATEESVEEELISGSFSFEIISDSSNTSFSIQFAQTDSMHYYSNLSSVNEIKVYESGLDLYALVKGESTSELFVPYNFEELIEIPLRLNSDEAQDLEIAIKDWDDVPYGVRIQLIDLNNGDQIEFDEDTNERINIETFDKIEIFDSELPNNITQELASFLLRILPEGYIDPDEETQIPEELELYQNYPNPFNPVTTISFYLPESSEIRLSVYNVVGQPVATLISGDLSAGEHQIEWDASQHPSGIYIYQLEVGNKIMTRKMTLVK